MKTFLAILLLVFSGVQFVRPTKNVDSGTSTKLDVFTGVPAAMEIRTVIQAACYDCHSNQTRYPWYSEIQPAGWILARHVKQGKRALNFSEFGRLPPLEARRAMEAIADEVAEGRMPLESYGWAHPEARLSPEEREALAAWAEEAAHDLTGEKPQPEAN